MGYYFLEGSHIGYHDLGLCYSPQNAMIDARSILKQMNNQHTYRLRDGNDNVLATIRSCPQATYKWK